MKVIVIGSEGFVGKNLCRSLQESNKPFLSVDQHNPVTPIDIRNKNALHKLDIEANDIVVNLAARQYADKPPKKNRQQFFDAVNVTGLENILTTMQNKGCKQLICFSTDMVYGLPQYTPINIDHPKSPLAEYGKSKQKAEALCQEYREKGFSITLFRPRLILGPGRLGVLEKLFKLIAKDRPVPLIGDGENYYQMVSVFDCVSAILKAIEHQCPNKTYNLGSKELISVNALLSGLIKSVNSRSKLIKTNARLVKWTLKNMTRLGLELMYPEQYALADQKYCVDISNTEQELNWQPRYNDSAMLKEAYHNFLQSKL